MVGDDRRCLADYWALAEGRSDLALVVVPFSPPLVALAVHILVVGYQTFFLPRALNKGSYSEAIQQSSRGGLLSRTADDARVFVVVEMEEGNLAPMFAFAVTLEITMLAEAELKSPEENNAKALEALVVVHPASKRWTCCLQVDQVVADRGLKSLEVLLLMAEALGAKGRNRALVELAAEVKEEAFGLLKRHSGFASDLVLTSVVLLTHSCAA